jgi:hypothetical protein
MALRSVTYSAHISHMNSTAKCMRGREESLQIVTPSSPLGGYTTTTTLLLTGIFSIMFRPLQCALVMIYSVVVICVGQLAIA